MTQVLTLKVVRNPDKIPTMMKLNLQPRQTFPEQVHCAHPKRKATRIKKQGGASSFVLQAFANDQTNNSTSCSILTKTKFSANLENINKR